MLHLRVFGPSDSMGSTVAELSGIEGVRQLTRTPAVSETEELVTAVVSPSAADAVLRLLIDSGIPLHDVALTRPELIAPVSRHAEPDGIVWAELHGAARTNARPIGRYLAFMIAAGVIAGFGVLNDNDILTVGAMAISPDLLPITAVCTGLVLRRPRLIRGGFVTLAVGLGLAGLVAALVTLALRAFSLVPDGFTLVQTGALEGLTTVNTTIVCVAFAAGFAGMLATETRASAGVGVAISVTTIPAVAYLGVAAAMGEPGKAAGALAVLGVNVGMLLLGGTLTLAGQRLLDRRRRERAEQAVRAV